MRYVSKSLWSIVQMTDNDSLSAKCTSVASAKSIGLSAYCFIKRSIFDESASVTGKMTTAPERMNVQAAFKSFGRLPNRWKSSVSTAAVVASGSFIDEKASIQRSCHESSALRIAKIAPVSISPLVFKRFSQFCFHSLTHFLRKVWIAAFNNPKGLCCCLVELTLNFFFIAV